MGRTLYTPEHDAFRRLTRSFFDKECAPHAAEWEARGLVDREVWLKAGEIGLLGWEAPVEHGGTGIRDYRFNAIMTEEFIASGSAGFGFALHNDVLPSYLIDLTDAEQQARWLPRWVTGETIGALAMTEPGAGSDLKSMRTSAVSDGDDYIVNGAKTYITNGILADIVVVAVKTDPEAGRRGISLLVIERGMAGFERGRKLDKIGKRGQDTGELFFDNVRVPKANRLGEENEGFSYLMRGLARERVACAVTATALLDRAIVLTTDFVRGREVFGEPLGAKQNTRFRLADVAAIAFACRVLTDRAVGQLVDGTLTSEDAALTKLFVSERQWEAMDTCLQLFGGAGYMNEYEIARLWRDSRVGRILGGSSEIMRHIISGSMDLAGPS
ncbi:acyl-CoA dehydrogenase family protein [Pseudonocardia sp. GCM10023141]|uniref:acyl-CoA dehydrogenase family protein n=1 Tax=Pseudonocardia sp. GCM10023141 TaxID=3252653 RepID=UPI00361D8A42